MAGESAAEVARRLREKAQRQLDAAERWEKGCEGERATAHALTALPHESWTVFHDLRWPGRQRANIDHVAIGPGGVYVIDSKNWSGRIEVRGGVELRQNGRRRESSISGVAEAALAIMPIVAGATGQAVVPVLCFHRDERIAGWARDVMVCSTANIAAMLGSRPAVLTPEQVRGAVLALNASLRGAALASRAPRPAPRPTTSQRPASGGPLARVGAMIPSPAQSRPARGRARGSRPSVARLVVGLVLIGGVFYPPVRDEVSGLVTSFLVSTASGGASTTPGAGPADDKRTKRERQQREQRQQEAATAGQ